MKLVNPKFEEIIADNPLLHGEMCTRVCYKSESLATPGSAVKLLWGIANAGHTAMLEHISVYLKVNNKVGLHNCVSSILKSPYSKVEYNTEGIYISTNLRVIFEQFPELFQKYMEKEGKPFDCIKASVRICNYDEYPDFFHKRITIKFTMDRIGSQSFCRHRVFSFAQESTRWCNYIKDKFGSEISISYPCWLKDEDKTEFIRDMKKYEKLYFKWISKGYKAEEARYFLPFGLKTEIIMTGFIDAWEHFFALRNDSHAHSQAQELAKPLEEYFKNKGYII